MYESEGNERVEAAADSLPAEVLEQFAATRRRVSARSLIFWGEHCTECAMPSCYSTCEFYRPRADLRCRRFDEGMVRLEHSGAIAPYLLRVRFERWAKLQGWGNGALHPLPAADRRERWDWVVARGLRALPVPHDFRGRGVRRRYTQKKRAALAGGKRGPVPTAFLVEAYNSAARPTDLSLTIRNLAGEAAFQARVRLAPGYACVRIPFREIERFVDFEHPFSAMIQPDAGCDSKAVGTTLVFGALDFVHESAPASEPSDRIKCVVWDLDNTLWRGTLVEDGADKLSPDEELIEVIRELDRRGILHSVASKNDHDAASAALESFGMADYFLFPQISWEQKSEALASIAESLSIGRDSILFVDDSPFERAEVQARFPEVRVLDPAQALGLIDTPECDVPVTPESVARRQLYREQGHRDAVRADFAGDYRDFLRHCGVELRVQPMRVDALDRVHELSQRTNQLNFSGNRYDRRVLETLLEEGTLDGWVLTCSDRFGDYGTVGFAFVEPAEPRLRDLALSCRVQGRRIEHALLKAMVTRYCAPGTGRDFRVSYRPTARNAPAGRVFDDLGFERCSERDGTVDLALAVTALELDEDVIAVVWEGA